MLNTKSTQKSTSSSLPSSRISKDYNKSLSHTLSEGRTKSKSRSNYRSPDKESTLKKYQETHDNSIYSNDFEFEDNEELDLSYSKFSHISGVSFIVNKGSNDSNSISSSPFVQRIQSKLQDIEFEQEKKPKSRKDISSNKSGNGMYISESPTAEGPSKLHDENDSPFIEKVKIHTPAEQDNHQKSLKLKPLKLDPLHVMKLKEIHSSSNKNQDQLKLHNQTNNHSHNQFQAPKFPPSSNICTPDRRYNHQRNPSVKISLTPAQRFEKRPGTRSTNALENFQFSALVGRGAFANVYKGFNLKTNQVVAIKQILLEKNQDVMELMGEIDLLKILKHPNIVKYHGFVKTSTSLNVFLEFCSGGSLRQFYKKLGHGLSESQIIGYVKSILQGLNYLHEQGVVHRDVKAANVLIAENGDIKLADFGVATKVSSQHETVVGTPNWMAPETVLGGEGLCTASDVWSLGATIIELFTTNPPYHDLNPMATLHAIGTDDHPPLPKNISSLAKDFLLECFQKQPSLRVSAKLLLKHKWITQTKSQSITANKLSEKEPKKELKSIKVYSETNEENWDNDFEELKIPKFKPLAADIIEINDVEQDFLTVSSEKQTKYTKNELLDKFTDKVDDFDFDSSTIYSKFENKGRLKLNVEEKQQEEDVDPFLEIEIEDFDTNDLEIQSKMELLVAKLSSRVEICHSGNDDVVSSLIKITGRMLHLVKKYSISHDVLIRDHGILSLLELLDSAPELPKCNKLWYHTLSTLNYVFENNVPQFENFCLLGGIPLVAQFRSITFDIAIRLQVVKFVKNLHNSERALSMFVSCGGLRVLSKFVEEDFDSRQDFPLVAIECIHNILSKDLTRSKSDLCRMLSKYGVIFWLVVLLNRLTKSKMQEVSRSISKEQINSTVDKIIDIVKYFGQSEARVRVNVSSTDLFKLLIKVYPNLCFQHQLTILKFFKSMSCISDVLKTLYSADILEFLLGLMEFYTPSTDHYKEVINIVCPILYNCCYLNHAKEIDLVKLGAVPFLKSLSKINLPFRQFVLPILCELVYCEENVRQVLKKNDILSVYFNLLVDPYWQSNALDSILNWAQHDSEYVRLDSQQAIDCLAAGFMLPKVSNLESALDNYLKLITINRSVCGLILKESLIHNILLKLNTHNKNPVVQLNLLRILKNLIAYAKKARLYSGLNISSNVINVLETLRSRKSSVLVEELAIEIISLL